jgi:hypothetical protein
MSGSCGCDEDDYFSSVSKWCWETRAAVSMVSKLATPALLSAVTLSEKYCDNPQRIIKIPMARNMVMLVATYTLFDKRFSLMVKGRYRPFKMNLPTISIAYMLYKRKYRKCLQRSCRGRAYGIVFSWSTTASGRS